MKYKRKKVKGNINGKVIKGEKFEKTTKKMGCELDYT